MSSFLLGLALRGDVLYYITTASTKIIGSTPITGNWQNFLISLMAIISIFIYIFYIRYFRFQCQILLNKKLGDEFGFK